MDDGNESVMCPECGGIEIYVNGTACGKVYSDNGTLDVEEDGKMFWDEDCGAFCGDCNWHGVLKDAIIKEAPKGCLTVNKGKEIL